MTCETCNGAGYVQKLYGIPEVCEGPGCDGQPSTTEIMERFARVIRDLKMDILCIVPDGETLDPVAEQALCAAVDTLSSASHQLMMAAAMQTRALGEMRMR